MLAADKEYLEKQLSQEMIRLQWKELQYLYQNAQALATTSAVLVGFGFLSSGVNGLNAYSNENNVWTSTFDWTASKMAGIAIETVIGMTISLAMSFNLITLFTATVVSMAGPGLALRGPEGSVTRAVRHMETQNKGALRYFGRGISAFTVHLAALGMRACFTLSVIDGCVRWHQTRSVHLP